MAARFWVGGSGNWDASTTTNWSTLSGGSGGASVPTSSDTVTFDTLSNATAYTVTVTATANCSDLTIGAPLTGDLTFAGSSALNIFGSSSFYTTLILTYAGTITYSATSTGKTITTNAVPLLSAVTFNGSGGGWTLQDDFSTSSTKTITLTTGTLDTNAKHVTCGFFNASGSIARTLTLTNSTLTLTSSPDNQSVITFNTTTNLVYTSTGSTIEFTGTAALGTNGNSTFNFGNLSHGTVNLNILKDTSVGYVMQLAGASPTFSSLTLNGRSNGRTMLSVNTSFTVTNAFTVTGFVDSRFYLFSAVSSSFGSFRNPASGIVYTITAGSVSLSYVDFNQLTAAGAASPFSGTSIGDFGGNTNVTFTTPVTRYWVGDGGSATDTAHWSDSSNGSSGFSAPLAQDTIVFDSHSTPSGGQTVTWNLQHLGSSFDASAITSNPIFSNTGTNNYVVSLASSFNLFCGGPVNMPSGPTLTGTAGWFLSLAAASGTNNLTWSTATGLPSLRLETLGTYTLQSDITDAGSTSTKRLQIGTLDTNGKNVTFSSLFVQSFSSKTTTLTLGASVVTITGSSGFQVTQSGTTTINANTSEIKLTSPGPTIVLGTSKTYNKITCPTASSTLAFTCTTAVTISNLTISGSGVCTTTFQQGPTWTITTLTDTGASNAFHVFKGSSAGTNTVMTVTTPSVSFAKIRDIDASAGTTWYCTNCQRTGNAKNILFSSPTALFRLMGR